MSRLALLVVAAALGAGMYAAAQKMFDSGDGATAPADSGAAASADGTAPTLVQVEPGEGPGGAGEAPGGGADVIPLTSGESTPPGEGRPARSAARNGGQVEALVQVEPRNRSHDVPGGGRSDSEPLVQEILPNVESDRIREQARLLIGATPERLNEAAAAARDALRDGLREEAYRRYRELFEVTEERGDVFVGHVAEQLVNLSAEPAERLDAMKYLAERSREAERRYHWALEASRLALDLKGREATQDAWHLLTLAYLEAPDAGRREQVLQVVQPFLRKNLFSGGYSHLLERHTVQPGESLAMIARRYETTIDAIKYINGLESDVIQPRQGLLVLAGKVEVFVKKSEYRLWALVDGNLLLHAPVGLGQNDSTPVGKFVISERQENPTWYPVGRAPIPAGDKRNILGSRWLGFKDTREYSGFGIHGTHDASTIGRETSAGCIRMKNESVELLFHFVPYQTPVLILE